MFGAQCFDLGFYGKHSSYIVGDGCIRQRPDAGKLTDLARLEKIRPKMLPATEVQQLQLLANVIVVLQAVSDQLASVRPLGPDPPILLTQVPAVPGLKSIPERSS